MGESMNEWVDLLCSIDDKNIEKKVFGVGKECMGR